jgi:chromatin segregation and condensation protein Rec8/ScpA/Scc1 (kleisin family)
MASTVEKPFYLQPPWNILFDFSKLEKITPWRINVAFLLTSFLEEMEKRGQIDFRASGVALDSSALIYLMKSKLLLKLEEPPAPPPKIFKDFIPPPLFLPLRYELTSTTIEHLLQVLDEVLKGERLLPLKPKSEPILPPPSEVLPEIDKYLMEIQKQMEKLYAKLLNYSRHKKAITFSELVAGSDRLELIRTFILLLFLAQNRKVDLWQETEFGEIYIMVVEETAAEANGANI